MWFVKIHTWSTHTCGFLIILRTEMCIIYIGLTGIGYFLKDFLKEFIIISLF